MKIPHSGIGAVIVIAVILFVAAIAFAQRQRATSGATCPVPLPPSAQNTASQTPPSLMQGETGSDSNENVSQPISGLPRLMDLGTTTCVPCKMMIPVLEELRQKYAGELQVDFINVANDQASAEKYNVRAIPLQIFFDPSGKELFRHIGYWPADEIVKKWKELGVDLG